MLFKASMPYSGVKYKSWNLYIALRTHNIRVDMLSNHVLIAPPEGQTWKNVVHQEAFHRHRSFCKIAMCYVVHTKPNVEYNASTYIIYTTPVLHRLLDGLWPSNPVSSNYFHTALQASFQTPVSSYTILSIPIRPDDLLLSKNLHIKETTYSLHLHYEKWNDRPPLAYTAHTNATTYYNGTHCYIPWSIVSIPSHHLPSKSSFSTMPSARTNSLNQNTNLCNQVSTTPSSLCESHFYCTTLAPMSAL